MGLTCGCILHNITANAALCDVVHYWGIFSLPQCHTGLWYVRRHDFIDCCEKSMAFSSLVCMKLTIVQQHYVQISYTGFHPNGTIIMKAAGTNTFIHLSRTLLSLCWLLQKLCSLSSFLYTLPVPNFIQIMWEVCRLHVKLHFFFK